MVATKKNSSNTSNDLSSSRFGRVKNNLKMGLVGLPNVGKSSLFNLLTGEQVDAANYPFCTIEPSQARVGVPDERFDWLCDVWESPSRVPAFLLVTDIAGLIRGAHKGDGLGNAFLSHIQAVDGIFHIVRAFDNPAIAHVDESIDPIRDLETIMEELCQKDLAYLKQQRQFREHDVKKSSKMKLPPLFFSVMDRCKELLEANKPLAGETWSVPEIEKINELIPDCITLKPVVYLINLTRKDFIRKKNKWLKKIHTWIQAHGGGALVPFSVEFEQEWECLQGKENIVAREAFLADKKNKGATSILPKIVKQGYKDLNLIYYFTAGEKEIRCWTVRKGACAPEAAGVIHSDFQKGFIKAEVCNFEDFKKFSGGDKRMGMAKVKDAGKYRMEGKSYVVRDGDIMQFQHNAAKGRKKK